MIFKYEKQFQMEFKKWLAKNPPETTEVHELKLVKTGNFPIHQWITKNPHQARGLMGSKKNGCYHKLSDMSRGLKPFDSFFIKGAKAYLVVYFNKQEQFVFIDIDVAISLTKTHKTISFEALEKIGKTYSL